jgi:hypothetical protein
MSTACCSNCQGRERPQYALSNQSSLRVLVILGNDAATNGSPLLRRHGSPWRIVMLSIESIGASVGDQAGCRGAAPSVVPAMRKQEPPLGPKLRDYLPENSRQRGPASLSECREKGAAGFYSRP